MNNTKFQTLFFPLLLFITIVLVTNSIFAGNIDPNNDGSRYAWGENVGWINFNPSQGPGVTVTKSSLTGYAWGENIGWINLNPPGGGVSNDGAGNLSGLAWGENVGWINFAGVTINPATGLFSGQAWGENIGWINFSIPNGALRTSWVNTTTILQSNLNPSTFGQSVTFTATVTPGAATGTVAFKEGTTTLGNGTLSSGTATFSTSLLAADSHSIIAEYGGDSNYNGSTSPALIQTVNKANQTITFGPLANKTYGDPPFTVSATASSGLPVSFSIFSGPATIAGNLVTITGAGTVTVRASQAGDANYNPAPNIDQPFTVNKANQTITFGPLANKTYGDPPFTVSAIASSGLPVSFSIVSGPATIAGNLVTITGAGTVTVRASQPGDANYNPAPNIDQPFTVNKANQTITFGVLANKTYGDPPFTVSATASSGLPVSFSILSGPATIAGNTVTITGAGTVTVRTSQLGGPNYNPAPNVDQPLTVNKTTPSFSGLSSPTIAYGTTPTTLGGTIKAGSLVPTGNVSITLNGATQQGTINGTTGNFSFSFATGALAVGSYTISYTYGGDSNFNGTSDNTKVLTVNPVSQYTLSLAKSGSGSVMVNGTSHTLPWSGTFSSGSSVQLQAVPDTGWGFSSWSGDLVDSAISVSITMNSNKNVTATFNQSGWLTLDDDGDGIPNGEEQNTLHTDPSKKTLFVRPTTAGFNGSNFTNPQYWPYFVQNLFPAATSGYANIPAFTNAQIEIVVIGAGGHPYAPFNNYTYDPAQDCIDNPNGCFPNCTGSCTKRPHVDILEVTYVVNLNESLYSSLCTVTLCSNNSGHTFFDKRGGANTWSWDAKGYTPHMTSPTSNWGKYQYYAPEIFPFAIDNYIGEGAYRGSLSTPSGPGITTGNTPVGLTCTSDQCGCTTALCGSNTHNSSPMNLDDDGPVANPPDSTVEINGITYNVNMTIGSVTNSAQHYDRDKVLRRVIAHEMGHALLGASVDDHCQNEQCVMYDGTLNYDDLNFEGGCGHYDQIRLKIHNHTH